MITNIGEDMRYLIIGILGFLLSSCASIGAVIDSGKEVATGLLDMTVGTASKVVSAVAEDVFVFAGCGGGLFTIPTASGRGGGAPAKAATAGTLPRRRGGGGRRRRVSTSGRVGQIE